MKKLVSLILLMLLGASSIAQHNYDQTTVAVLSNSSLTIIGDTNISNFTCVFDTSLLDDPRRIEYLESGSVIAFRNVWLILNTKGFDCGCKPINQDFRALIKADKYPLIILELQKIDLTTSASGIATVRIQIAGVQKNYDVPVKIYGGDRAGLQGSMEISINHFNLEPPRKLFGTIVVKEDIRIVFNLEIKEGF